MKLSELVKPINGARIQGDGNVEITGLEYDSRRIKPGMLFIAVEGYKTDGNRFISDAIKNGAMAVMSTKPFAGKIPVVIVPDLRQAMSDAAANFYGFPGNTLEIAGVTGTNGKSTSVYLTRLILNAAGKETGLVNSLVYDTGKAKYKAERTTPDSVDMQRILSEMLQAGCTHGVVEVSSHALVLHRVDNIDFKAGLFTNFSRDHLDFHDTMEKYLAAKKLFLEKLIGDGKYVVINMDVPGYAGFTADVRCRLLTYSVTRQDVDVFIKNIKLHPDHSEFTLVVKGEERRVIFRLPGRYNLSNATGSAALGTAMGASPDHIVSGLEAAVAVPGRFQPVDAGQPFLVLIDYAHTPDAIERLCKSAREITPGKMMILFGCGGDRDRGKRPLMGEAASEFSDLAMITSDNPRTEDPDRIIEDIKPGMIKDDYLVIPDRREAILEILKMAKPGDTILVAGKGAEDYQEIGTTRYPFEDKVEISKALAKLGYKKG
ncbi:MAG: UDP-N-acetylmuramoyl-L-alanyl-D-glutamate--2,6-diaminopimelate ligase [candidate division Zixibacteria bacterium HGW-Zixibacteria-1]|nr:MAG: UDP-N-acetylmuramoyl-L-alanyl-D-glutamate--2,6-diaminopimelate ligase [candidate division Zixibacteria bacterium HGW-Zixibacteria-1]